MLHFQASKSLHSYQFIKFGAAVDATNKKKIENETIPVRKLNSSGDIFARRVHSERISWLRLATGEN